MAPRLIKRVYRKPFHALKLYQRSTLLPKKLDYLTSGHLCGMVSLIFILHCPYFFYSFLLVIHLKPSL